MHKGCKMQVTMWILQNVSTRKTYGLPKCEKKYFVIFIQWRLKTLTKGQIGIANQHMDPNPFIMCLLFFFKMWHFYVLVNQHVMYGWRPCFLWGTTTHTTMEFDSSSAIECCPSKHIIPQVRQNWWFCGFSFQFTTLMVSVIFCELEYRIIVIMVGVKFTNYF